MHTWEQVAEQHPEWHPPPNPTQRMLEDVAGAPVQVGEYDGSAEKTTGHGLGAD
jgi:hypothetical protein